MACDARGRHVDRTAKIKRTMKQCVKLCKILPCHGAAHRLTAGSSAFSKLNFATSEPEQLHEDYSPLVLVLQCGGNNTSIAFCQRPWLYKFLDINAAAVLFRRFSLDHLNHKCHLLIAGVLSLHPKATTCLLWKTTILLHCQPVHGLHYSISKP